MAWFKCSGGGIPAILKTRMNNVFNKKFGTSTTYQPDGWPDNVNLMGPLEEKTVSGSVVAFSDGADAVLLKSCEVTIAPNLDGVSSVGVVHTGKNLIDFTQFVIAQTNYLWGYRNVGFPLKKGVTYTFSCSDAVSSLRFVSVDEQTVYAQNSGGATDHLTYTPTADILVVFRLWSSGINVSWVQLEVGSTATAYAQYVTPTTHSANLGRTIYGGEVDVVQGTGTDENGNDFTFTPVPIISRLGDNTMWGDGDLSVVYRSSGTQTLIPPTLISKTITANGTYSAEDDGADGYDEVTVNVQGGGGNTPEATQTLICDNSALGSSLTFTDDYENYDLIKFVVYRSDIGNQFTFYMTPAMINAMGQYSSNRINFNQPYGNNFVCYTKTSNTSWTRYGVRNLAVKYVYGLTFTNCTVTETELYNRQGIGSSNVTFTPPTGETFLDYDYILLATCTGNSDETQANLEVFQPDIEKDIFGSDNADENSLRVYKYNQGGTFVTVTENTITAFSYFYACGLKLSYNQQNLLGGFNSNSEQGEQENEIENELNELNNEQEETPEEVDQNESNE